MANNNSIDLIVGKEAILGLETLISKLGMGQEAILKMADAYLVLEKNSKINTKSGSTANTNATTQLNKEIQEQAVAYNAVGTAITKLTAVKKVNNKLSAEESVGQGILNKNALEHARTVSNMVGSYQKLNIERRKAQTILADLLSAENRNSAAIKKAQADFDLLDKKVKAVNASTKNFSLNVGNYKSAFNGIGGSLSSFASAFGVIGGAAGLAMVTRDMFEQTKALESLDFALKTVTGAQENFVETQAFLSRISGAYGGEINTLTQSYIQFYASAKNKLAGKEIQDIFEGISKSAGVLGLSTERQEKAFLALNQMMSKGTIQAEELRGQLSEALPNAMGIMKNAVQALNPNMVVTEKIIGEMMKKGELLSAEVLPEFSRQMEKSYGIENVKRVDTLNASVARLSNGYKEFVRSFSEGEGGIKTFFQFLVDGAKTALEQITRLNTSWDSLFNKATMKGKESGKNIYSQRLEQGAGSGSDAEIAKAIKTVAERDYKIIEGAYKENEKKLRDFNPYAINFGESGKDLKLKKEELTRQLNEQASIIREAGRTINGKENVIQSVTEETKAIEGNTKAKKENRRANIESVGNLDSVDVKDGALERLKMLRQALEKTRGETAKNATEFEQFNKSIDDVNKAIDILTKPLVVDIDIKPAKESLTELTELTQEMKSYLRSFVDEFSSKSGFEGVLNLFDGEDSLFSRMQNGMAFTKDSWKSDTVAIMEGVQEMYNFISDASQANFDKEYERLDMQKETALKFAGDSSAAKEKIEADYEKKKKQIAEREFKAKQKQAIVNVAIDTAQAIMSLWANPGFPAAIPMTIAVGNLGALQIGTIAAQKIPQYFEGGTHDGGLMLVNDAKGSNYKETIVTPDGKILQPTERNVLMDAPSGTQIFTPEQWHEKQLFDMMQGKGIAMTNNYAKSNGLTYEQMDAVIGKHFANITTQTNVFDKNGFSSFSSNQGNITIRNNNRNQGTGFSV